MADLQWKTFKVTNNMRGPRVFNMPTGGQEIVAPGQTKKLPLDELEVKDLMIFIKDNRIVLEPVADDEEDDVNEVVGIDPHKPSEPPTNSMPKPEETAAYEAHMKRLFDEAPELTKIADADKKVPANVVHRGGGRYYGMDEAGEVITDAMTKDDAVAYAKKHDVSIG
jgi:hypothetical protein